MKKQKRSLHSIQKLLNEMSFVFVSLFVIALSIISNAQNLTSHSVEKMIEETNLELLLLSSSNFSFARDDFFKLLEKSHFPIIHMNDFDKNAKLMDTRDCQEIPYSFYKSSILSRVEWRGAKSFLIWMRPENEESLTRMLEFLER